MEDGGTADIIAIQEPWIGGKNKKKKIAEAVELGNGQITVGHNGYDIVFKQGKNGNTARVMWMIRKDNRLKWTIRDDLWDSWDASICDIQLTKDQRTLRIVNIYNQSHGKRNGWCMKEWPEGIGEGVDLMVIGDFNASGALWDTQRESCREEMVMEVVQSEELVLLNEPDKITRRRGKQESVLDLAWVGENMQRRCNWKVLETDTGSDHASIEIVYSKEAERVLNPISKKWNLKEADWKKVQETADQLMDDKEVIWQRAIENQNTEEIAKILEETAVAAMEAGIPEARMSWKSKKWYDKTVREKRKEVNKHKRWAKKKGKWRGEEEGKWKKARNELFRTIRKKKKEMWEEFIGGAKSQKEMWTVWRALNNRIYMKTPTLVDPQTRERAESFEAKERLLRRKLFPQAPSQDQEREQPGKAKGRVAKVTEKEVREAIETQGNNKAPGPDGIMPEVLKKLDNKFRSRLTEGLNIMLKKGEHPPRWRTAIGAIIPKPGKGDYTTPRSYRPISLLNTTAKVLEKIVQSRITTQVEKSGGLHKWQWGGRTGRGAEECVEWTLDWVREKQKMGKKVAVIAMDIDQAFPNVAKKRLGNRLRKSKIEEELVEWTESFMEGRKIKLRFDGREAKWENIDTGIPQGSPISPLLFNIYIAPLLERLEEYCEKEMEDDAVVPTFIDDVTMVIAGDTWEEVVGRGEKMMEKAYKWAEENDVQFAEDKLEWIRIGGEKEEETEKLRTPKETEKEESKIMRWLGVWIDQKMSFKKHVEIKIRKAEHVTAGMRRIAKGKEGCGVGNMRKMYIACARSVMDYGSRVWWSGQKELAGKMDRADEKAMRSLGGHLRTAPGGAIRVENNLTPNALRMDERQRRIAIRTLGKDQQNPMRKLAERAIKEDKEERRNKEKEWGKKGIRKAIRKGGVRCGIEKIGSRIDGKWRRVEKCDEVGKKEKKWEEEIRNELVIRVGKGDNSDLMQQRKKREEADEVIMYTDGSKKEGKVGAGVCRIDRWGQAIWEKSYGLGGEMEIMDAEMVGIKKAVEQGTRECKDKGVEQLVIRTDSQEAMFRIRKRENGAGEMMAHKIRWAIDNAKCQGIQVIFEWTKAHADIAGNERADILAKAGCEKAKDNEWFISLSYLAADARREVESKWMEMWEKAPNKGKYYEGTPNLRNKIQFPNHERNTKVTISRLRTGHIWINKYSKRVQKAESEQCECGQGVQDVQHILEQCEFTANMRRKAEETLEKEVKSYELLYTEKGIEWAVKIWKEFSEIVRNARGGEEREDRELGWGYGELERD